MKKHTVATFLKAPIRGKVKTRLAKDVGEEKALAVYQSMVEAQLARLPEDWEVEIHYTPAEEECKMREWLGKRYTYLAQADGDLGQRLRAGIAGAFERGAEVVCAIGGDCPKLDKKHFLQTLEVLQRNGADCVFGPCADGGYYLVGMNRPLPQLFEDVPWSSLETLRASLQRAKEFSIQCHLLQELPDVDTIEDLRHL